MKIRQYFVILSTAAALFTTQGCEHPLKNVEVEVNTDPFAYGILLRITDELDNPVSDVTVTIGGEDAEYIYNQNGYKQFDVENGTLILGIHPLHRPTETKSVTFSVQLSGSGYITKTVPFTITAEQYASAYSIQIHRSGI
ncbi:hypothetical protein [Parapedobacter sp.]